MYPPNAGSVYSWTHRNYYLRLPTGYDPSKAYPVTIGGSGCGGPETVGSEGGYSPLGVTSGETEAIQVALSYVKSAAANNAVPDIQVALAKINDALLSLSRELEATDADPEYFQQRSIALGDWLRQMDLRYTSRYSSVNLKLIDADNAEARILASDEPTQFFFHFSSFKAGQRPVLGASVYFRLGQPIRLGQKVQAIGVRLANPPLVEGVMSVLAGVR